MKLLRLLATLAFLFSIASPVGASQNPNIGGGILHEWCGSIAIIRNRTSPDADVIMHSMKFGYCQGYVLGVVDGLQAALLQAYCIPQNVATDQLVAVVIKELDDNPADWNQWASIIISRALLKSFPCRSPG